jgi:hypothetical protein
MDAAVLPRYLHQSLQQGATLGKLKVGWFANIKRSATPALIGFDRAGNDAVCEVRNSKG